MKKTIYLLLVLILGVLPAFSQTKAAADSAYAKNNYAEAAERYEKLLAQGASPELYYNLGNAYYKLKDIPRAIQNYRRALKYDPAHRDARFNLSLCESRLTDRFDKQEEMFFFTWFRELWQSRSVDWWGGAALWSWAGVLLFALIFFFGRVLWLRKAGFFATLLSLCLVLLFNLFAHFQQTRFEEEHQIVLSENAQLYTSPSLSAKASKTLHEGCTLTLTEGDVKGWLHVVLPDGETGWLPAKNFLAV